MTKQLAVSKKSGKEFEVISTLGGEVCLRSEDGDDKFIKENTFKKNYDVREEVIEESTPEEVKEDVPANESFVSKSVVETIMILLAADSSIEGEITNLLDKVVVAIPQEANESELIRIRDNNRQCFKENENRFRLTARNHCADDEKYLIAYVEKMCHYYKAYTLAKQALKTLKTPVETVASAEV